MFFRCGLTIACASLLLTLPGQVPSSPAANAQQTLPAPSGSYAIGQAVFDWEDKTRVDEFASSPGQHRELMVYLWYPSRTPGSTLTSEYFPAAREIDKNVPAREAAKDIFGQSWPEIVAGSLRSHAVFGARVATERGGFPVILFSPGASASSFSYTAQIENFVSHGYVVVAIDHPGLSGLIRFADGHVRLYHSDEPPSPSQDPLQAMINSAKIGTQSAAEDLSFVLDKLSQIRSPLRRAMNLDRVAAVGHSAGGTVSVRACQLDTRIKACVSEDGEVSPVGAFFDYPDHPQLSQPFLLIQIAEQHTDEELKRMGESREVWNAYVEHEHMQLSRCPPGSYLVTIIRSGFGHSAFSDGPSLNAQQGSPEASATHTNLLLTEDLERVFLDQILKSNADHTLASFSAPLGYLKIQPIGR